MTQPLLNLDFYSESQTAVSQVLFSKQKGGGGGAEEEKWR